MTSFLKDLRRKMVKELEEEGKKFINSPTIATNLNIKTLLKNIKSLNHFIDDSENPQTKRKLDDKDLNKGLWS